MFFSRFRFGNKFTFSNCSCSKFLFDLLNVIVLTLEGDNDSGDVEALVGLFSNDLVELLAEFCGLGFCCFVVDGPKYSLFNKRTTQNCGNTFDLAPCSVFDEVLADWGWFFFHKELAPSAS